MATPKNALGWLSAEAALPVCDGAFADVCVPPVGSWVAELTCDDTEEIMEESWEVPGMPVGVDTDDGRSEVTDSMSDDNDEMMDESPEVGSSEGRLVERKE
jgi:hypothetical protein